MVVNSSSDVNYALKAHPGTITVFVASRKGSKEAKYTAQWNRTVLQLDNKVVSHVVSDMDDKLDKKDRLDEIAEAEADSQGSYRDRPWLYFLNWTEPLCSKETFRQSTKAEKMSQ